MLAYYNASGYNQVLRFWTGDFIMYKLVGDQIVEISPTKIVYAIDLKHNKEHTIGSKCFWIYGCH